MFDNFFYDLVLYNRMVKKITTLALKQNSIVLNPIYQYFYRKLIKRKASLYSLKPFRVMIENTNVCNANCIFCPHYKMKRKTGVMSMALFKKVIDECFYLGINFVTIYGFGEPLLDKNFFERIKYAKNKGIKRITTNTNAAFLDEKKAKEMVDQGLDEVYISFDAATPKTYKKIRPNLNFNKVEENIKKLMEIKKQKRSTKPLIYLSFVENDLNVSEISIYERKWKKLVDGISFSQIHNWTGEVNFGEKEPLLRDPCRLLWTDMVVSWNGNIPLCCNDYENRVVLGNISKQSIKEIWGGKRLKEIRQFHLNSQFEKIKICANCFYNYHHKSPWWVNR